MDNIIDQPLLSPQQKELAEAKTHLSDALAEVKQEMYSVESFLRQLRGKPFSDFIHQLLQHKFELECYLSAAKDYMIAYSFTRQRLISFADDKDIYFIPYLLNPARESLDRIMKMLKKEKAGVLQFKAQPLHKVHHPP